MTMKYGIPCAVAALVIHICVYELAAHPMLTANGDQGLAYLLPSTLLYFPVSFLAWGAAFVTHDTSAYTGTLFVLGALWYCWIGFHIGRIVDRHRQKKLMK